MGARKFATVSGRLVLSGISGILRCVEPSPGVCHDGRRAMTPNKNLYHFLRQRFPHDLSQAFLETDQGSSLSYGTLEEETARTAAFLVAQGLRPGDRVLSQVEKTPQVLILFLACVRAGLVFLPLNPAYRRNEVRYITGDAEPRAIICRPESLDDYRSLAAELGSSAPVAVLETLNERGEGSLTEKVASMAPEFATATCGNDDMAALVYTSGTTGRPKGAMITHGNLASNAQALCEVWRWQRTDVLLHCLPLYHAHGLFISSLTALLGGGRILFLPRFDAEAVIRFLPQATVFMGVPTYYTRLVEQSGLNADLCRNTRLFISGSAPLLRQTFEAFRERTGHAIVDRYGMTETGVIASNPVDGPRIPGAVGKPLPSVRVRIADEKGKELPPGEVGEIQIQGKNVFAGYWRKSAETAAAFTADGYLHSGDLGQWNENGYLAIVGRSKDLIISGGLNVYPKEVEAALDQQEGVQESAVIGVPHPDFGEAVVAVVVRDKRGELVTEAALVEALKKDLANYKVPKRIFFTEELPRNPMGKVQKNDLRNRPEYASIFSAIAETGS
jgi:malonyl-CoA/methylmalonyl-CoA synthetase